MENTVVNVEGMYYSNQSILYVGEGDFSFSSSHATRFGVANNIVATSLDLRVDLLKKYGMDAIQNIMNLTDRGAQVIHSLDARNMAVKDRSVPLFAFGRSCFDVVAFNFPHAGFFGKEDDPKVIRKHTELMQKFFKNATLLLAPGGVVYVAHKCGPPYNNWNLEENANKHGLQFVGSVPFQISNFPGYKNRRGSGDRAGDSFELGKAAIYKFALRCGVWVENIAGNRLQTGNKQQFLLQILSNLRFPEGVRSSTPLFQIITDAVARLENQGLASQIEFDYLKVVVKVVPLLVKPLAIHQIQNLNPSRSYNKVAKSWSKIQELALKVMKDEHEELEPGMCDLVEEQEVTEIYVSDDIADGALGEEQCHEEAFSAFVLKTPMSCSMDRPDDIHGIDHINSPTGLGEVYEHQTCDDNQSGMPGLNIFGVSSVEEDKQDGLEAGYLGIGFINWVIEKILSCGLPKF